MLSWLVDVESMQMGQKPFAVDYKALKSQVQLQQVQIPSSYISDFCRTTFK